jgi:hypothetical protein
MDLVGRGGRDRARCAKQRYGNQCDKWEACRCHYPRFHLGLLSMPGLYQSNFRASSDEVRIGREKMACRDVFDDRRPVPPGCAANGGAARKSG